MNRFWIVCLWLGFAPFCNPTLAQENRRQMIILDPGHGGVDSGAIGINGIMEKDVVLEVAKESIRLNKELFGNTLDIYLTRYNDTLISLGDRTKLVKILQPDIFISIHCNQADRREAQGIEVYVQQPNSKTNSYLRSKSENLGESLLSEFDKALGFKIVQPPIVEEKNHVECYMEQNPCNEECYEYSEMLSAKFEGMNQ